MSIRSQSLAQQWAHMFGFFVLALVIAAGSCRFSRAKADVLYPNPCSEERLRALYGDDWHIAYALLGCWAMDPANAARRPRIVVGGAR